MRLKVGMEITFDVLQSCVRTCHELKRYFSFFKAYCLLLRYRVTRSVLTFSVAQSFNQSVWLLRNQPIVRIALHSSVEHQMWFPSQLLTSYDWERLKNQFELHFSYIQGAILKKSIFQFLSTLPRSPWWKGL